jgi:hypothetical protein
MNILKTTSLFVLTILLSCTNTTNKQVQTIPIVAENNIENTLGIQLNGGNKWKVVPEMLIHIRAMERDVTNFKINNELANYKALAQNLQLNIDKLTANCTMEGQAHDELHKWLLPYIDDVAVLATIDTTTKATVKYNQIKNTFEVFNVFFE